MMSERQLGKANCLLRCKEKNLPPFANIIIDKSEKSGKINLAVFTAQANGPRGYSIPIAPGTEKRRIFLPLRFAVRQCGDLP